MKSRFTLISSILLTTFLWSLVSPAATHQVLRVRTEVKKIRDDESRPRYFMDFQIGPHFDLTKVGTFIRTQSHEMASGNLLELDPVFFTSLDQHFARMINMGQNRVWITLIRDFSTATAYDFRHSTGVSLSRSDWDILISGNKPTSEIFEMVDQEIVLNMLSPEGPAGTQARLYFKAEFLNHSWATLETTNQNDSSTIVLSLRGQSVRVSRAEILRLIEDAEVSNITIKQP